MKDSNTVYCDKPKSQKIVANISRANCWSIKDTNIPVTWEVTKGRDMLAMVVDTGHPTHRDIGSNAIEGNNFTNSRTILDRNGHQTAVTGVICAKHNTSAVGVAPHSKAISVKALGDDGSGSISSIESALEYALEKTPDVVCMSLGSTIGSKRMHKLIKQLYKRNIPIVAAAGNDGRRGVDYPARYPETIAVAAFDRNGNIGNFSAVGPEVDFAAPGVDVYTTWLNNEYTTIDGTSFAAPYIVGVILLLLSKHRMQEKETGKNDCKTVDDIKEHLLKYTDRGVVGKDNSWGYGQVDVERLIKGSSNCIETLEHFMESKKWYNKLWSKIKFIFRG